MQIEQITSDSPVQNQGELYGIQATLTVSFVGLPDFIEAQLEPKLILQLYQLICLALHSIGQLQEVAREIQWGHIIPVKEVAHGGCAEIQVDEHVDGNFALEGGVEAAEYGVSGSGRENMVGSVDTVSLQWGSAADPFSKRNEHSKAGGSFNLLSLRENSEMAGASNKIWQAVVMDSYLRFPRSEVTAA